MAGHSFRKLRVYRLAVLLTAYLYRNTRAVPSDAKPVVRQMIRATSSIVLNIAEGSGEFAPLEKAKFYRYARRSATETVGTLDTLFAMRLIAKDVYNYVDSALDEITAMLVAMAKTQEVAGERSDGPADRRSKGSAKHEAKTKAAQPPSPSPSPSPSPFPSD